MSRSCVEWNEYSLGRKLTISELYDRAIDELRDPEWANMPLSAAEEGFIRAVVGGAIHRTLVQAVKWGVDEYRETHGEIVDEPAP